MSDLQTTDTELAKAEALIARLYAELDAYRAAAQYDPTMEGPIFKGWNRSALDRARRLTERRLVEETENG